MIHLHTSNHVEQLVDVLIGTLRELCEAGTVDPLEPTYLIIPNPQVETFLKVTMARSTGIAANLHCTFLRHFLADLLPQAPTPMRLLDRHAIHGMTLGMLGRDEVLQDPELQPVQEYLAAAGTSRDDADRRRFQLAGQIARLFEEYSFTRPDMLQAWKKGQTLHGGPYKATEAWQRAVWLALFGPEGERERLAAASGTTWVSVPELCGLDDLVMPDRPSHLHVFGLSYIARAFHQMLARLAQDMELYLYTLYPWRPDLDDDHLSPVLRLWGRPGRENYRIVLDTGVDAVQAHGVNPTATEAAVLQRLQHAILLGQPLRIAESERVAGDQSLRLLACPSMRREVEILAGEIWALVRQEEAGGHVSAGQDRLRFHDIAVLVNSRDQAAYQTHIAAVFKEFYDIPHTLIDVPAASESGFVEAVGMLLALPFSAFTRQDLLRLLTHPAFLSRLPEVDAEEWLTWCEQLSIVHGADQAAHADTYIERDLFNWEQGSRRLLLGTFMSGARSGETRAFQLGEAAYLPQEYAQDRLANAVSFALVVRSLIADARFCQTARLSLTEWAAFLSHLLTAYLDAAAEADERYVSRCLQLVQALEELDFDGQPVAYRMAYELVMAEVESLEGSHGDYLAGGVVVSSFQPMRPIPFRAVFVVGLGEGAFPSNDRDDPLDVRQAQRQVGDVSTREQDLYMFLETLVSTRQRLYLSYVCRDAQTGEVLQPSSVIQELLAFLAESGIPQEVWLQQIVHHPLTRYDRRYFPDLFPEQPQGLENLLPAARGEAQALALHDDLLRFCQEHGRPFPTLDDLQAELEPAQWRQLKSHLGLVTVHDGPAGPAPPVETLALSLASLRQFLYCPLQGWARYRLGLREDGEEDIFEREDEPFVTPRLFAALLLRDTFLEKLTRDAREGVEVPFATLYDERAAHGELAGLLPTGLFFETERAQHLQVLARWHANLCRAQLGAMADLNVLRLGRAEEHAAVDALLDPITVDVDLSEGETVSRPVRVELYGRTEAVCRSLPGSLTLVMAQQPQERDVLRGFFDGIVCSVAGLTHAMPYHAIVNAAAKVERTTFAPFRPDEATAYLRGLVRDLLAGPHTYLLPIEAVLQYRHPKNVRPVADLVNDLRDNPYARYSSQYGPVSFPERFAPPAEAEAERIMERRFGLFFEKKL